MKLGRVELNSSVRERERERESIEYQGKERQVIRRKVFFNNYDKYR